MSPAEKPTAHDELVAGTDDAVDEELLAEMFDRFLEDQFEGRASDLSGVLPLDRELREKASEAYEFAREFVARKTTERSI